MENQTKSQKYRVMLCREASEYCEVEITAESPEIANNNALQLAGRYGENLTGWKLTEGNMREVYLPGAAEEIDGG